ncbi:MAG: ABC-type transport auxiliary lipoprotein family protein [Wenzhouxiangella sp.]
MNLPPSYFCRVLRLGTALLIALALAACGLGGRSVPVTIVAPQIDLQPHSQGPEVAWSLQVRRPQADRMRDSEQMLIRTGSSRLQTYPAVAWLDNAPDMLQALTIHALDDSGRFTAVGRPGDLRARFALASELRRFEGVDDQASGMAVELVIQSKLIDQRSGAVAASRTFRVSEPAGGDQLDALVPAFERAIQNYFEELIDWVLVEGERHGR